MTFTILEKTDHCGEVYSRLTAKCGISMRLEEEVTQDGYRLAAENTIWAGKIDNRYGLHWWIEFWVWNNGCHEIALKGERYEVHVCIWSGKYYALYRNVIAGKGEGIPENAGALQCDSGNSGFLFPECAVTAGYWLWSRFCDVYGNC